MVDALSGVSAVGPVIAGQASNTSLGTIPLNTTSGLDIAKAVANELSSLELSSTGQLIESVLGIALPQTEQSPQAEPLLASPALSGQNSTPELAQSLNDALAKSGIFYESHLADWVSGLRTQAQILEEPQAKLDQSVATQMHPSSESPANALQSAHTLSAILTNGIHPQSVGILQQQLQSMDNQVIPWQGQIWPGQDLQWSVQSDSQRDEEQQHHPTPSPIQWKSTLKLSLPHLGEVQAELRLGPQGCQISLISEAHQVSDLKQALPILGTRLQDAGIRPEQLTVKPKESIG